MSITTSKNVITLRQLRLLGACKAQRDLFEQLFGKRVEVTVERAIEHAADFDVAWLASNTLTAAARAEYDRVRTAARAEYDRATAPAWAEYVSVAEHNRVMAAARAEYDRVGAAAWATAFLAQ